MLAFMPPYNPFALHPVALPGTPGRVLFTACPGRPDGTLADHAAATEAAGAALVLSLIEDGESSQLPAVAAIRAAMEDAHLAHRHLPIADLTPPAAPFEAGWAEAGRAARDMLRAGAGVMVHCRGGLGRSGTVAARLLVELGTDPAAAIAAVRAARPGAIETDEQKAHVHEARPAPDETPFGAGPADRARGALLGLALGDALGTTLEFSTRDTHPRVVEPVGGGPFRLAPGQWTDDTAMALALAESLAAHPGLDPHDLMARFVGWWRRGTYSCTGECFDIGTTTSAALARFEHNGEPFAGDADPRTAGNGSLMRLAPAAIARWREPHAAAALARAQSRTTHAAEEAVEACAAFATLLAEAIAGRPKAQVLAPRTWPGPASVAALMAGGWRGWRRGDVASGGYVIDSLGAALWCVARTGTAAEAMVLAANLAGDADTTAAIAGQLAGALHGERGLPDWPLAWRARLAAAADAIAG